MISTALIVWGIIIATFGFGAARFGKHLDEKEEQLLEDMGIDPELRHRE